MPVVRQLGRVYRGTVDLPAKRVGPPTAYKGSAYVGSDDEHVYRVDLKTGDLIWKTQTRGEIRTKPQVDDGTVYFGSEKHKLYAVDID